MKKKKISCLSLMRAKEFDEDLGNDCLIDLYPIKGTHSLVNRVASSSDGHSNLIMINLVNFLDIT